LSTFSRRAARLNVSHWWGNIRVRSPVGLIDYR
jgi:hypothetical protein